MVQFYSRISYNYNIHVIMNDYDYIMSSEFINHEKKTELYLLITL